MAETAHAQWMMAMLQEKNGEKWGVSLGASDETNAVSRKTDALLENFLSMQEQQNGRRGSVPEAEHAAVVESAAVLPESSTQSKKNADAYGIFDLHHFNSWSNRNRPGSSSDNIDQLPRFEVPYDFRDGNPDGALLSKPFRRGTDMLPLQVISEVLAGQEQIPTDIRYEQYGSFAAFPVWLPGKEVELPAGMGVVSNPNGSGHSTRRGVERPGTLSAREGHQNKVYSMATVSGVKDSDGGGECMLSPIHGKERPSKSAEELKWEDFMTRQRWAGFAYEEQGGQVADGVSKLRPLDISDLSQADTDILTAELTRRIAESVKKGYSARYHHPNTSFEKTFMSNTDYYHCRYGMGFAGDARSHPSSIWLEQVNRKFEQIEWPIQNEPATSKVLPPAHAVLKGGYTDWTNITATNKVKGGSRPSSAPTTRKTTPHKPQNAKSTIAAQMAALGRTAEHPGIGAGVGVDQEETKEGKETKAKKPVRPQTAAGKRRKNTRKSHYGEGLWSRRYLQLISDPGPGSYHSDTLYSSRDPEPTAKHGGFTADQLIEESIHRPAMRPPSSLVNDYLWRNGLRQGPAPILNDPLLNLRHIDIHPGDARYLRADMGQPVINQTLWESGRGGPGSYERLSEFDQTRKNILAEDIIPMKGVGTSGKYFSFGESGINPPASSYAEQHEYTFRRDEAITRKNLRDRGMSDPISSIGKPPSFHRVRMGVNRAKDAADGRGPSLVDRALPEGKIISQEMARRHTDLRYDNPAKVSFAMADRQLTLREGRRQWRTRLVKQTRPKTAVKNNNNS